MVKSHNKYGHEQKIEVTKPEKKENKKKKRSANGKGNNKNILFILLYKI